MKFVDLIIKCEYSYANIITLGTLIRGDLMYLKSIFVQNYRLYKELHVTLNRGLNVLVGENDSGKTSLIDAIRLVLGTKSSDRFSVAETDFYDETQPIIIRLSFANACINTCRFSRYLICECCDNPSQPHVCRCVLHVQLTSKRDDSRARYKILTKVRIGHDGEGPELDSDLRDYLAVTYLKPLRDAETELSSGRASRLSRILGSSNDILRSKVNILKAAALANDFLMSQDAFTESMKGIREDYFYNMIFEDDKDKFDVQLDIAGIRLSKLSGISLMASRRYLRAILEKLNLTLSKDGNSHGLGYHNILFMAAELILLAQEIEDEFGLLLIEEPEAHLHPQLQMKVLKFIDQRVWSKDNEFGIQCIITTNSPNLSSKADPQSIFLLRSGKVWSLRIGETLAESDEYKYLRKFLDATKANVFFARGVLFVEGDTENILLPRIAELLGRPLEDYGVSVVKYDNSGSWKRFARLFLRSDPEIDESGWIDTRVCVLRDLDLWPDCADKDDENGVGFKEYTDENKHYWKKYWRDQPDGEKKHIEKLVDGLEQQNVKVFISNDWTFEYCLAKHGLFKECIQVVTKGKGDETISQLKNFDVIATYIQKKVQSKTDFAYEMSEKLSEQLDTLISESSEKSPDQIRYEFALDLAERLPEYIVTAIEHLTKPIEEGRPEKKEPDGE